MENKNLWNKDFTLITASTVISAIGGEAINLPLSLMVFDQTKSTFLAAVLLIMGMLPDVILPIFIAPFVDNFSKKKLVVGLNSLTVIIYITFAVILNFTGFDYSLYLIFSFLMGTVSVVYRLAYQAWYPDLIPIGFEQKGYAVSSTIYPTVMIVMAPVAAFLYQHITMSMIFIIVAALTAVAVGFQWLIERDHIEKHESTNKFDFIQYKEDLRAGFRFLKLEKGIRNIYSYMSMTGGVSFGVQLMTQAYFQSVSFLTITLYGFLTSAETIGRMLAGLVQYKVVIPSKKRYGITKFVYIFYDVMDMILLFLPYPLMIANRFACGLMGTTSATIRESCVQSYLPRKMRAKVNAVFSVAMSFVMIAIQLIAGALGERLDFRTVAVILGLVGLLAVTILIVIPSEVNRKVYEATRVESIEEI